MPENSSSQHHVSWSDRLGFQKIWHDAINDCRMTYGTEEYRRAVFGLHQLILDVKDGPKLRTLINKYKNVEWEAKVKKRLDDWKKKNPYKQHTVSAIQFEEEQIRNDLLEDLFTYMIQLLEDNNYGFYHSDLSTDQISLTSSNGTEDSTEGN
jgi:hypothetical protein